MLQYYHHGFNAKAGIKEKERLLKSDENVPVMPPGD